MTVQDVHRIRPSPALLRLIFLLLPLTIVFNAAPSQGNTFDCVKLPRPPLNGRVQYVGGKIKARLKCSKPGYDLPLTASGNGGILTCRPEVKPFDFINAVLPTCLPYKRPSGLRMPAISAFTLPECDDSVIAQVKSIVIDKLQAGVPRQCFRSPAAASAGEIICKWKNLRARCGKNFNEQFQDGGSGPDDPNSEKLMTVEADLVISTYDPEKTVDDYQSEMEWIHSSFLDKITFDEHVLPTVKFRRMSFFKTWKASCAIDERTAVVGTTLALHKVASCRGCPMAHMLDWASNKCWQCPRGQFTPKPFAKQCMKCPKPELWSSNEVYAKNCGSLS